MIESVAQRDDELRQIVLELDKMEKGRSALQSRMKLLLGMSRTKRVRSRFSQAQLDAWAKGA